MAEAVVEPARWFELRFDIAGQVAQVLVSEGDRVAAGAPLLSLDTDALALSLQSAEQEVIAQKAALAQLIRGTSAEVVARADKENADQIVQAEIALQAVQLQLEKARADDPTANVAAARARVKQLQLRLAETRVQDPVMSVTVAQIGLERAKIALDDTQNEYRKALDRPWEDQLVRDEWAKRLKQVQLDYRLAEAQLESALNLQRGHSISLDALAAQVEEVQAQLVQAIAAQGTYTTTLGHDGNGRDHGTLIQRIGRANGIRLGHTASCPAPDRWTQRNFAVTRLWSWWHWLEPVTCRWR